MQLLVKYCVSQVVSSADSVEEVLANDALGAIFDELTQHQTCKEYVRYLFSDILEFKFNLDTIADKAVAGEAMSQGLRRASSSVLTDFSQISATDVSFTDTANMPQIIIEESSENIMARDRANS